MAEGPDAPAPSPEAPAAGAVPAAGDGIVSTPILAIRSISKRFGSTQALDDVSLDLHPGEIHALLGENGAGKSTLIKIMTGVEQPDTGEILRRRPAGPRSAALSTRQRLGIAAIYQEPMIFPDLSVAENIFICHRDRGRFVDRRRMGRDARGRPRAARRPTRRRRAGARPDARPSSRPSRSPRRSRSMSAS